jgi:hypothetical protein
MRISDTIQLKRAAVDLETGKLLLRVMKTGAPLYVRLGAPATAALRASPDPGQYFFSNHGNSLLSFADRFSDHTSCVSRLAGGRHRLL